MRVAAILSLGLPGSWSPAVPLMSPGTMWPAPSFAGREKLLVSLASAYAPPTEKLNPGTNSGPRTSNSNPFDSAVLAL
jgi:hypothetical protein